MDRILALPDLAGLSGCRTPPRVHRSFRGIKQPRRHKEWEPPSDGEYEKKNISREDEEHEPRNIIAFSEQDPLDLRRPAPSADPFDTQDLAHISGVGTASSESASLEDEGSWEDSHNLDMEQDIDISYSDFEAGFQDRSNGSMPLSPGKYHSALRSDAHIPVVEHISNRYQQSSPPSLVHSESHCLIDWPEDYSVRSQPVSSTSRTSDENSPATPPGQEQYTILSRNFGNDVTNAFASHDDLPMASPNAPCPSFSSNNLYEHEDPWHTIGVILGLSPGKSHMFVHDTMETSSASCAPNLQDDERNFSISAPVSSHFGNSPAKRLVLSAHSSSSHESSSSASGRPDLNQDGESLHPELTTHGHSSPYRLAPARCSSIFRLNFTDGKNSQKGALRFNSSSSDSFSSFGHVLLHDDDKHVPETCDTGKLSPLRYDSLASEANDSLMSSPHYVYSTAEHSNMFPSTLSPAGTISNGSRLAGSSFLDLALTAPKSTIGITDPEQLCNDPYDRIGCYPLRLEEIMTRCTAEEFPLPAGISTEGDEITEVYYSNRKTPPPTDLLTPFELNVKEVDGVFRWQGPCLFGEDSAESD